MTSKIDQRNKEIRKQMGISGALTQDAHTRINAKYPGLTREHCFMCECETGRAGKAEDSMYDINDAGPYCEECYFVNIKLFSEE